MLFLSARVLLPSAPISEVRRGRKPTLTEKLVERPSLTGTGIPTGNLQVVDQSFQISCNQEIVRHSTIGCPVNCFRALDLSGRENFDHDGYAVRFA